MTYLFNSPPCSPPLLVLSFPVPYFGFFLLCCLVFFPPPLFRLIPRFPVLCFSPLPPQRANIGGCHNNFRSIPLPSPRLSVSFLGAGFLPLRGVSCFCSVPNAFPTGRFQRVRHRHTDSSSLNAKGRRTEKTLVAKKPPLLGASVCANVSPHPWMGGVLGRKNGGREGGRAARKRGNRICTDGQRTRMHRSAR